MAGVAAPTSPSRLDTITKTVIGHASNALLGATTVVKACTRTPNGTLNLRLRTASMGVGSSSEEAHETRTRRALLLVDQELKKHMPLVRCTLQNSDVDGVDEVEVSVPGHHESRCRALVVCEAKTLPSILRVIADLLVASAVALIVRPFLL